MKNSNELDPRFDPAVKITSSPVQNVFAITFDIRVATGVGRVCMLKRSDSSKHAVVSVATPL